MTIYTRRATIVVTAADQPQANAEAAAAFDTDGGGEYTFSVPLSASGSLPATHYWCSTACTEAMYGMFTQQEAYQQSLGAGRTRWLFDGLVMTPDQVLAAMNLKRIGGTP